VSVNGTRLWYEQVGSGEPIVHLHGSGLGHQNFAALTPLMAPHMSVVDFDMRGYGESQEPGAEYSMRAWSEDIVGLLDALEIEKTHMHGTSFGGMVAQQFAIDHPDRLRTLVLSATSCKLDYAGWLIREVWVRITEQWGFDEVLAMAMAPLGRTREFLDSPDGRLTVERMPEAFARACTPEVFIAACRAVQEADFIPHLPAVRVPTLAMTGEQDASTPPVPGPAGGGVVRIAELIPGCELVLLPEVGHTHIMQRPRETADVILDFIARRNVG
jgi:pimeloyl-ACP methyl ester carboxylesterase